MTEKLINSKPNGVFALILIELTIVLGIFIFIMGLVWKTFLELLSDLY